jgi:hypothetical protein
MVNILSQHLREVSGEQERAVKDICHSNAIAIAQTVSELEKVHGAVEGVKASLVNGNTAVQVGCSCLTCFWQSSSFQQSGCRRELCG